MKNLNSLSLRVRGMIAACSVAGLAMILLTGCGEDEEKPHRKTVRAADTSSMKTGAPQGRQRPKIPDDPAIFAQRQSIPGGQVVLPDDPAFLFGKGWGEVSYEANREPRLTVWTTDDHQVLDWDGPEKPGEYVLTAHFWRTHPFPVKDLVVEYLLPGETEWRSMPTPLDGVQFTGKIATQTPRQKLHIEFKIPGWVPQERIPGSTDPRKVGFIFTRLELAPTGQEKKSEAGDAAGGEKK